MFRLSRVYRLMAKRNLKLNVFWDIGMCVVLGNFWLSGKVMGILRTPGFLSVIWVMHRS